MTLRFQAEGLRNIYEMAFLFFSRDTQTLELLARVAVSTLKLCCSIRVWDAGGATGTEPYAIAAARE